MLPHAFAVLAEWRLGYPGCRSMNTLMPAALETRIRAVLAPALLLGSALASSGCAVHYIPNTDVEDNAPHRSVVSFCEAYRKAVERKDVATLLGLAAPGYYEEGPNADASDDVDYAGLRAYLTQKYETANNIRYEMRYRRITLDSKPCVDQQQNCDRVLVDYTYSGSYRLATKEGEKWKSTVEENRLELIPSGETFLILTGM